MFFTMDDMLDEIYKTRMINITSNELLLKLLKRANKQNRKYEVDKISVELIKRGVFKPQQE